MILQLNSDISHHAFQVPSFETICCNNNQVNRVLLQDTDQLSLVTFVLIFFVCLRLGSVISCLLGIFVPLGFSLAWRKHPDEVLVSYQVTKPVNNCDCHNVIVGVYLMHPFIRDVLSKAFGESVSPLRAVMIFAGCVLVTYGLRKIPVLRKVV